MWLPYRGPTLGPRFTTAHIAMTISNRITNTSFRHDARSLHRTIHTS
jgi:hypothetical protein